MGSAVALYSLFRKQARVPSSCRLAWCLPTGFQSIVPYFYAVRRLALAVLLRAARPPARVCTCVPCQVAQFAPARRLLHQSAHAARPIPPPPRCRYTSWRCCCTATGATTTPAASSTARTGTSSAASSSERGRRRGRGHGRGSTDCQGKAASCLCASENGAAGGAAQLGHALRRWSGGPVQLLTGQPWLALSFLPAGTACSHSSIELPLHPSSLGTPALLLLAWPLLPSACCRLSPLPASLPPALLVFRHHTTYRCCNTPHDSQFVWMHLCHSRLLVLLWVHCKAVLQPGFATYLCQFMPQDHVWSRFVHTARASPRMCTRAQETTPCSLPANKAASRFAAAAPAAKDLLLAGRVFSLNWSPS